MFLNQARPAILLDDIKENVLEWIRFTRLMGQRDSSSTAAEVNSHTVAAYAKRAQELEHKRSSIGLGLTRGG